METDGDWWKPPAASPSMQLVSVALSGRCNQADSLSAALYPRAFSCVLSLPFLAAFVQFKFDAPYGGTVVLETFPVEMKLILPF